MVSKCRQMKCLAVFIGMAVFFFTASAAFANGLAVSNTLLYTQNTVTDTYDIQFDITWENSWFENSAPLPTANWDAAWVFAKFSKWDPVAGTWGPWTHCTLSSTLLDHATPSGARLRIGCSPAAACDASNPGKGVFIYRDVAGAGTVNWTGARLRWLYGTDLVADNDRVKVNVLGVEMVYIPTGDFYIGDSTEGTPGTLQQVDSPPSAAQVTSSLSAAVNASATNSGNDDDAVMKSPGSGIRIDGDDGLDNDANGSIDNASFPTGYSAFYMMKYDVSQRQYAAFLNMLTRPQQTNRVAADISGDVPVARYVMSNSSTVDQRDAIAARASGNGAADPVVFGCDLNANSVLDEAADGGWNAAINLNWMDAAAYAAWAGLRPFTELEFEKAARGPLGVVKGEYAWGNADVYNSNGVLTDYAIYSSGTTSEGVSNPGSLTGNAAYYEAVCDRGPNHVCGPMRVGIFAVSGATSRQETGGSYYGVMGLSGNVWKRVVTVGNAEGRVFDGTHGSGALSANGNAAQVKWPGYSAGEVTGADGSGFRGGSWISQANSLRVSDRDYASVATTLRTYVYGARAARTAPAP